MTAWAMLAERDGLESVHGGPGPGGLAEGVVDFSVNVNPFGPAPAAAEAWIRADPVSYPDPSSLAAREVIIGTLGTIYGIELLNAIQDVYLDDSITIA